MLGRLSYAGSGLVQTVALRGISLLSREISETRDVLSNTSTMGDLQAA